MEIRLPKHFHVRRNTSQNNSRSLMMVIMKRETHSLKSTHLDLNQANVPIAQKRLSQNVHKHTTPNK